MCPVLSLAAPAEDPPGAQAEDAEEAETARRFRFDYQVTLLGISEGDRVRVWMPIPPSNEHQQVEILATNLPAEGSIAAEPKYGNKILYFELTSAEQQDITFSLSARVTRRQTRSPWQAGRQPLAPDLSDQQRKLFLSANRRVPIEGKPLDLLTDVTLPDDELDRARALFDRVDQHVRYDKSRPGYGRGDVLWVCDSRFGNCTDFHSLFMSLARSQGLPTRFEIGFALPREPGEGTVDGYHCWAMFYTVEHGWVPVDISEADKDPSKRDFYFGNLTEDRVLFTVGRDIDLVPQQSGAPLNYFIYPHVEVNEQPVTDDRVRLRLAYSDL